MAFALTDSLDTEAFVAAARGLGFSDTKRLMGDTASLRPHCANLEVGRLGGGGNADRLAAFGTLVKATRFLPAVEFVAVFERRYPDVAPALYVRPGVPGWAVAPRASSVDVRGLVALPVLQQWDRRGDLLLACAALQSVVEAAYPFDPAPGTLCTVPRPPPPPSRPLRWLTDDDVVSSSGDVSGTVRAEMLAAGAEASCCDAAAEAALVMTSGCPDLAAMTAKRPPATATCIGVAGTLVVASGLRPCVRFAALFPLSFPAAPPVLCLLRPPGDVAAVCGPRSSPPPPWVPCPHPAVDRESGALRLLALDGWRAGHSVVEACAEMQRVVEAVFPFSSDGPGPEPSSVSSGPCVVPSHSDDPVPEHAACTVCLDARSDVFLRPCGHACLCAGCAARLTQCPVCRKPIKERLPMSLTRAPAHAPAVPRNRRQSGRRGDTGGPPPTPASPPSAAAVATPQRGRSLRLPTLEEVFGVVPLGLVAWAAYAFVAWIAFFTVVIIAAVAFHRSRRR